MSQRAARMILRGEHPYSADVDQMLSYLALERRCNPHGTPHSVTPA
jgi:hypothetical protein